MQWATIRTTPASRFSPTMEVPISLSSIEQMANPSKRNIIRVDLRVQRKLNFKSKPMPKPEAAMTSKLKYVRVPPETPWPSLTLASWASRAPISREVATRKQPSTKVKQPISTRIPKDNSLMSVTSSMNNMNNSSTKMPRNNTMPSWGSPTNPASNPAPIRMGKGPTQVAEECSKRDRSYLLK